MTLANNGVAGAGTSTAALAFGGNSPRTMTQSWNGTNWSHENGLTAGTAFGIGAGTQTLALAVGGENAGGTSPVATTQEWNGTGLITRTITTTTD